MIKRLTAMTAALILIFAVGANQKREAWGEPVQEPVAVMEEPASYQQVKYEPIKPKEVVSENSSTREGRGLESRDTYSGTFQRIAEIQPDICAEDVTGGLPEYVPDEPEPANSPEMGDGTGCDDVSGQAEAEPEGDPVTPEGEPSDVEEYSGGDEDAEQDAVADVGQDEVVTDPEPEPEPAVEEPQPEWSYYGSCRITHYCDCPICTGPWYGSATASGAWPSAFYTVASGEDLPFGTEVLINGQVYVVQDRGVGCGQIDIFVGDHQLALDMGEYYADVYVR